MFAKDYIPKCKHQEKNILKKKKSVESPLYPMQQLDFFFLSYNRFLLNTIHSGLRKQHVTKM